MVTTPGGASRSHQSRHQLALPKPPWAKTQHEGVSETWVRPVIVKPHHQQGSLHIAEVQLPLLQNPIGSLVGVVALVGRGHQDAAAPRPTLAPVADVEEAGCMARVLVPSMRTGGGRHLDMERRIASGWG